MRFQYLIALSCLFCSSLALWPLPKEYTHGSTVLWLPSSIPFSYYSSLSGHSRWASGVSAYLHFSEIYRFFHSQLFMTDRTTGTSVPSVDQIIKEAIWRTQTEIQNS